MTDDLSALDNLRPEVREAVERMIVLCAAADKTGKWVRADCDVVIIAKLLRLTRENEDLRSKCNVIMSGSTRHLGRAERAEAELAALKSQPISGPAQDAIIRFGCGEVLSHEEMCEIVNQAVCAGRELAALKARIADAPVASVRVDDRMHVSIGARSNAVDFVPLHTKHVALVKVED